MRRMLFTTVAITAMLAAAPACHNTRPKIATPPAVENVRKVDTMDDAEKKLQVVPKKVEGIQTESSGSAQSNQAVNLQGIKPLRAGGSLEKQGRAPEPSVGPPKKIPISD
jgi:hypothetical protein